MTSHKLLLLLVLNIIWKWCFQLSGWYCVLQNLNPTLALALKYVLKQKHAYTQSILRTEHVSNESCQRVITSTHKLPKFFKKDSLMISPQKTKKFSLKRQISDWKFGPVTWLTSESFLHVVLIERAWILSANCTAAAWSWRTVKARTAV